MKTLLEVFRQIEKKNLQFETNVTVRVGNLSKKVDAAIFYDNKIIIAIEINFYTTSGSKVTELFERAYPDLKNTLSKIDCELLVVTDGKGWLKMRNTLRKAFSRLEHICNYNQLEYKLQNLLEEKTQ